MGQTRATTAEKERKPTQATKLVDLASSLGMFHTKEGEVYARIALDNHIETWNLRTKTFKQWLAGVFHQTEGKAPSAQAMADALTTISGIGQFDRPEAEVHVRMAAREGQIYLDLANDKWEAIEIGPTGWTVLNDPPVYFRRPKGLKPLPYPDGSGDLVALRRFFNLPDGDAGEAAWKLIVAWLIQAARPEGPYPVLVLNGEQGSAKSTLSKALKATIDPSTVPLRTMPGSERDLAIIANNGWVLAFDNLSNIRDWLSDAVCRLSTGGGFSTRQLYTDDEECLFSASRPVVLNGIDQMVDRHDLADRCIFLNLPPIPDHQRKTENGLWSHFRKEHPGILGAVLNAISTALANLEETELDEKPRMADFAIWVKAAEPALPWDDGGFLSAYQANRKEIVTLALDADMVATAIMEKIDEGTAWEGTATDLLKKLEDGMTERDMKRNGWPQNPNKLSNKLRRLATFLRPSGIEILLWRHGSGKRIIQIERKKAKSIVGTVGSDDEQQNQRPTADDATDDADDTTNSIVGRRVEENQAFDDTDATDDKKASSSFLPSPDACYGCGSFDLAKGGPGCLRANRRLKDMERCPLRNR